MAKFRNISGEAREIPEAGGLIGDDELFTVADDRAGAFADQPWFKPEDQAAKKAAAALHTARTQDPSGGATTTTPEADGGSAAKASLAEG